MKKEFLITRTQTGRKFGGRYVFLSVYSISESAKNKLLSLLDEWYGDTDQEVETWAVEYQLWARYLLSSDPYVLLNPKYLELSRDLPGRIAALLGPSLGQDYITALDALDEVQKAADKCEIEDGDCALVTIECEAPHDWVQTDFNNAQWCRRVNPSTYQLVQTVPLFGKFGVASGWVRPWDYSLEEKERILRYHGYRSWTDLVARCNGSSEMAHRVIAECICKGKWDLLILDKTIFESFEEAEERVLEFIKIVNEGDHTNG